MQKYISLNVIKSEIHIKWCLSLKHGFGGFHDCSGLVGFSGFHFWFGFASNISQVIFDITLKHALFFGSSALVTVDYREDKRIAAQKNLAGYKVHIMNSARAKIGFSWTNYFRSIVCYYLRTPLH